MIARDPHHQGMIRSLQGMRFLGSFAFGSVATVRILQLESVGVTAVAIGSLMAGYSVLVGVVEIPSGAVADVWGRRRTKLISLAVLILAFTAFGLANSIGTAALALVLLAIGRALASGPMESWFVDEIGDPHHPTVLAGISAAEAAHNVGTALGAVVGGLVPWLLTGSTTGSNVFGPVFALAGLALVADAVITMRQMKETVSTPAGSVGGVWRTTFVGVKVTLDAKVSRWVAAVLITYGALNATVELLTPLGLSAQLGKDSAALWFGALVAVAWLLSAFTATQAPKIASLAGSPARATGIGTLLLVALTIPAALASWVGPAGAYIGLNTVGGPLIPLLATIIHRQVGSAHRSTAMSTLNLSFMLGATIGSAMVAALDRTAVFVACAAALASGWGLLRARPTG